MLPILLAQVATSQTPTPQVDPMPQLRSEALSLFRQLQFTSLDRDQWIYLAEYYGLRATFVIVLMILAWTISGWLSAIVSKGLTRVKFDETLTRFLAKLVRWGILFLTALTCLSYFGVETTSFAAVIGAAGLAIGLAFQGTLSNFAAGAMLLIFRPYKVGDEVTTAGFTGKVHEIALFTTEIDTGDGRRIIIPNSSIFGAVIENITYHPQRRIDVPVGVAYDADIDETRRALERAIDSVTTRVKLPKPAVVLLGLGASSVDWSARIWARQADLGQAKEALIRAVKLELDRAGIGIPFPQMEVHWHPATELPKRVAESA